MLRAALVGAVRREGHHAEGTRHAHRSRPGVRAIAHHFPAHPNACAAGRERARERERGRARGRGRGRRDATAHTRTQTSELAHRISISRRFRAHAQRARHAQPRSSPCRPPGCSSGFRTRSSCSSATATSGWRASSARRPSACAAAASRPSARTRGLCARPRMRRGGGGGGGGVAGEPRGAHPPGSARCWGPGGPIMGGFK
jgi:hypothetical protein